MACSVALLGSIFTIACCTSFQACSVAELSGKDRKLAYLVHSHFILQAPCIVFDVLYATFDDPQAFVPLLSFTNPVPAHRLDGPMQGLIQQLAEGQVICPVLYEFIEQCEQVSVVDVNASLVREGNRVAT